MADTGFVDRPAKSDKEDKRQNRYLLKNQRKNIALFLANEEDMLYSAQCKFKERGKYLSPNEQPVFEGGINEAESESNLTMPETERVKTASKVRKSQKTGKHRGRNELRSDLEIKKVVYELPASRTKELAAAEKERETAVKYAIADTAGKYQCKIDEMQLKIDDI